MAIAQFWNESHAVYDIKGFKGNTLDPFERGKTLRLFSLKKYLFIFGNIKNTMRTPKNEPKPPFDKLSSQERQAKYNDSSY